MDSELVRFRVDPERRDRAAQVCAGLGVELNDVLRALVTRIAHEGTIPFDVAPAAAPARQPAPDPASPPDYGERWWSALKPQLDAERAMDLLSRFIAECSAQLDPPAGTAPPTLEQLVAWTQARADARRLQRELDVGDAAAVRRIIDTYGPLLRRRPG